ncbi:MAG: ATP-binding cassette domain-containing protein [Ignavibacteriae bacterium]|nr:ATP-binding cassette domain-containing protein [Ignavibacteriota bacterium]
MLTVTNLRKEFSSVIAVDRVSFEVGRGEIFGLLGPNGAGKTTTIRMALNILQPDGGEIRYDGERFSEKTRNIIGYLPEERGLYKKSKVFDTILYFAQLRGMNAGAARAVAYRWLHRFSLLEHRERKVEELSKGNQQKVQFICALIHDPVLVILDEPFSGLDPVNQILFKDVFMELKQAGKAVVYSTHQMDQAERLSDTLCLIDHGRVVLSGSVRNIKKRYGKNSVHIEFDGNGAFMDSLPGVRRAIMYEHSAELELGDGVAGNALLGEIVGRVEVRKFELLEPSLQSIFIQVVGMPDNGKRGVFAREVNVK